MQALAAIAGLLALAGLVLAWAGAVLVRRFAAAPPPEPRTLPGISVLKPLYGDEPLLEQALASVCAQDYPLFQVVFGVQDPADPALAVARRVRARFPDADIALVVDDSAPGRNRKVANLTNMLPAARHDMLVIADSDVHAAPDYLRRLAAALEPAGSGMATTLYVGLPASRTLAARLGASAITHGFLPGALLARALGRQDALGATHGAAARDAGGGRRVRRAARPSGRRQPAGPPGARAGAGDPARRHGAGDHGGGDAHRRAVPPRVALGADHPRSGAAVLRRLGAAISARLGAAGGGAGGWCRLGGRRCSWPSGWRGRRRRGRWIGRWGLGPDSGAPWRWPLRDLMSVAVLVASYMGDRVEWRGRHMRADGVKLAHRPLGIERA